MLKKRYDKDRDLAPREAAEQDQERPKGTKGLAAAWSFSLRYNLWKHKRQTKKWHSEISNKANSGVWIAVCIDPSINSLKP